MEKDSRFELLAMDMAYGAHKGQTRRDGDPYIEHVSAVARRLRNESEAVLITGWLHDILEDTDVKVTDLIDRGFSDDVIQAVQLLTRSSKNIDDSYIKYIERIKEDPIARKVKIADILDNISDAPTRRQIRRYAQALLILTDE